MNQLEMHDGLCVITHRKYLLTAKEHLCAQVQNNATHFTLQKQHIDISIKCAHKAGVFDLPSGSSIAKQIIGIILSISEYLQEELTKLAQPVIYRCFSFTP